MRSTPELDKKLRQRLVDACQLATQGNADAFGRMLGYTNGGYIREVIRGVKPVREALIERVQSLDAFKTWFIELMPPVVAMDVQGRYALEPWPFQRISREQWERLSERERGAIEDALMAKWKELQAEKRALLDGPPVQAVGGKRR